MKTILLVEDDENDVLFFRHAFKKAGLTAHLEVASDGHKAVEYLTAAAGDNPAVPIPCLVLLDLNLPKKPGLEVLRWIRNHPKLKSLVVIVLTSSNAEADAAAAYALCANSYLVKPSDPVALAEVLRLIGAYWMKWNYVPR